MDLTAKKNKLIRKRGYSGRGKKKEAKRPSFVTPVKKSFRRRFRSSSISSPLEAKNIRNKLRKLKDEESRLQSSILLDSMNVKTPSMMSNIPSSILSTGKKIHDTLSIVSQPSKIYKPNQRMKNSALRRSRRKKNWKVKKKNVGSKKPTVNKYLRFKSKEKKTQVKHQRRKKYTNTRSRYSAFSKFMSKYGRNLPKGGDVVKVIKKRMTSWILGEIARKEMQRRLWASNYIKRWFFKVIKQRRLFKQHMNNKSKEKDLTTSRVLTRDSICHVDKQYDLDDSVTGKFSAMIGELSMIEKINDQHFDDSLHSDNSEYHEIKEILSFVEANEKRKVVAKNGLKEDIQKEKTEFDMIERQEKSLHLSLNEREDRVKIERLKKAKEKKIMKFFEKHNIDSPLKKERLLTPQKKVELSLLNESSDDDISPNTKDAKRRDIKKKTEMFNFFAKVLKEEEAKRVQNDRELKYRMRNKLRVHTPQKKNLPKRFVQVRKEVEDELNGNADMVGSFEIENGKIIHKRKGKENKINETPIIVKSNELGNQKITEDIIVLTPAVNGNFKKNDVIDVDINTPKESNVIELEKINEEIKVINEEKKKDTLELQLGENGITNEDLEKFGISKRDLLKEDHEEDIDSDDSSIDTSGLSSLSTVNSKFNSRISNYGDYNTQKKPSSILNINEMISPITKGVRLKKKNSSISVNGFEKMVKKYENKSSIISSIQSNEESSESSIILKKENKIVMKVREKLNINENQKNRKVKLEKLISSMDSEMDSIEYNNKSMEEKWKKEEEKMKLEEEKKMNEMRKKTELEREKKRKEEEETKRIEEEKKRKEEELKVQEEEKKRKEEEKKQKEEEERIERERIKKEQEELEKQRKDEEVQRMFEEALMKERQKALEEEERRDLEEQERLSKMKKNNPLDWIKQSEKKENLSVSRILESSVLGEFSVEIDNVEIEVETEKRAPTKLDVEEESKNRQKEINAFIQEAEGMDMSLNESEESVDRSECPQQSKPSPPIEQKVTEEKIIEIEKVQEEEEEEEEEEKIQSEKDDEEFVERRRDLTSTQKKQRKKAPVECCTAVLKKGCTIL